MIRINRQNGAALVVSLVILIAMTMLGITSMRSSSTELTMAGNLRESELTFQAAEAGLRSAEAIVNNSISPSIFDGSSASMLSKSDIDPDYFANATWEGATPLPLNLTGISTNPKYVIKYLGDWAQNPLSLINIGGGYADMPPGQIISNFRVTVRGSGQTGRSFSTVQSYFGKEY